MPRYTPEAEYDLKEEYKLAEKLALGAESDFGKLLITILDNSITQTEHEWANKGLNTVEDNNLLSFRNAVRSKLQTLKSFRRKLTEAKEDQARISKELESIKK